MSSRKPGEPCLEMTSQIHGEVRRLRSRAPAVLPDGSSAFVSAILTPSPGHPMPFPDLNRYQAHTWCTHIHAGKTSTHMKLNKSKLIHQLINLIKHYLLVQIFVCQCDVLLKLTFTCFSFGVATNTFKMESVVSVTCLLNDSELDSLCFSISPASSYKKVFY